MMRGRGPLRAAGSARRDGCVVENESIFGAKHRQQMKLKNGTAKT